MSAKKSESTTARIPLTPTTLEELRDLGRGLGMTYDETIKMLMRLVVKTGEDPLLAGRRLKQEFDKPDAPDQPAPSDDPPTPPKSSSAAQPMGVQAALDLARRRADAVGKGLIASTGKG